MFVFTIYVDGILSKLAELNEGEIQITRVKNIFDKLACRWKVILPDSEDNLQFS